MTDVIERLLTEAVQFGPWKIGNLMRDATKEIYELRELLIKERQDARRWRSMRLLMTQGTGGWVLPFTLTGDTPDDAIDRMDGSSAHKTRILDISE